MKKMLALADLQGQDRLDATRRFGARKVRFPAA
jgi:hypothetical protein